MAQAVDHAVETVKVAPPLATAVLTLFGYPIADVVQAVMLVWGLGLVAGQFWKLFKWVRREGWRER